MADDGISIYLCIGYHGNSVDLNVMKYYCLLLSFLWGFVFFVSGQERISVCNLRCEYLEDPVAVENEKPLLSWQLQSSGQAKSQTAYRILVASSPSLLAEGKADFWDSGKITSSRSSQVGYEGKPLDSRQTLYWKAMVWDEAGEASPWSETGRWTMGLLEPSDWTARWIGNREDAYPDSTLTTPAPYFRKTFRINKPVKRKGRRPGIGSRRYQFRSSFAQKDVVFL